ncbi:Ras GTPase-activating-like protein iqgap1, partial [Nowakowskiella sp. JEL0078]
MPQFGEVQSALAKELSQVPTLTDQERRALYFIENLKIVLQAQNYARGYLARKQLKQLQARHQELKRIETERQLAIQREEEKKRCEEETRRIEEEKKRIETENRRIEEEKKKIEEERLRFAEEKRQIEEESQRVEAVRQKYWLDNSRSILKAQSLWRGIICKRSYSENLKLFKFKEAKIISLQARIKAIQTRKAYLNRLKHFNENQSSIIKIQSRWRGRHAEKAYKALASLDNPQVKILQDFIHLLDDSDNDFEEELELEQLRQLVIKLIRENIQVEAELSDLDVKIALLVKNRISIEEVVHLTSKKAKQSLSPDSASPEHQFSLKGADKETRTKIEHYQELFYLLQTQPHYLAKLLYYCNKTSGGNVTKVLENATMTLFGYAQNTREEYLFLNLIK